MARPPERSNADVFRHDGAVVLPVMKSYQLTAVDRASAQYRTPHFPNRLERNSDPEHCVDLKLYNRLDVFEKTSTE